MAIDSNHGAFVEKILLQPPSPSRDLPLSGLTFAVKDIFDVAGHVTGFGNPDWARTHPAAESTAPAVSAILSGGATCIGITVMDEMAYSINGENEHYGTPTNPCAPDRVPGGSSSGSAVAVGADLADFSLGTDTGGSVRVPSSYCGIFGFRPSHGVISTSGVTPMAQSFDTVGWFARNPAILNRVGQVLLQLPDMGPVVPTQFIIAEDCFQLSSIPSNRVEQVLVDSVEKLFGGHVIRHANLRDVVKDRVPSLNTFLDKGNASQEYNIPPLTALSSAMRLLQRYEFKNNHGEWVSTVRPDLGPGIAERVWEAVQSADENVDVCHSIKTELRAALTELLGDFGVLAIPTVPGAPPKLQTDPTTLETFRARAFSLLSIAGLSGLCQVSIPLGLYDNLPVSVSLLAKHGSDGFLLNLVETLYDTLKEQFQEIEVKARAPGKIILSGEHAVVHGSTAVASSIDLYTYVSLRFPTPSDSDDALRLQLKEVGLEFSWPIGRLKAVLSELDIPNSSVPTSCSLESTKSLAALVDELKIPEAKIGLGAGVLAFLWLYSSIQGFKPATVVITSELPLGSGLGSSAAFCVALSGALLSFSDSVSLDLSHKEWTSFGESELDLLNKWAFEGEKIIHGKPSGIDNTVSTYGNMIKFRSGSLTRIKSNTTLKMLITNTKVGRNTKALVAGVSERTLRHPKGMASVFNAVDSISTEMANIIQSSAPNDLSITEKEAKIEELMEMNQGLLQCMGVSHASIETVIRTTLKYKLASKLTGAGGGGCVLTLLPTLLSGTVAHEVTAELESCGFRCLTAAIGGNGVEICFGGSS